MLGASYDRIADSTCSALRSATDATKWIAAGIFADLEQACRGPRQGYLSVNDRFWDTPDAKVFR